MATQVIELELTTAPPGIPLRADVENLFVVVTDHGVPVSLARIPRPASGILVLSEIFARLGTVVGRTFRSGDTSPPSPIPISIIICTHERPDDLARCLENLAGAIRDGHEVIVVDNAPVTGQTAAVASRAAARRVVEPRRGLNRARNAGLAAASHDIVAYVDDDVVASPSWATAIATRFDEPHVACVTGLVLPLELETGGQEQFELYCAHRRRLESREYSRDTIRPSAAGVAGMGANMAFRKDVVIRLGTFDERLGPPSPARAADETDMFARILDAGHHIVYEPAAYVWHRHRRTVVEVRSAVYGYGVGVFAMLTKRVVEQRDLGALVTAGRWLAGPVVKRALAAWTAEPAARWDVVLAETMGALTGPFAYAREVGFRRTGR